MKINPPNTRYDWRDPEMPVLRFGFFVGTDISAVMELTPVEAQAQSIQRMSQAAPDWRNDPTYGSEGHDKSLVTRQAARVAGARRGS